MRISPTSLPGVQIVDIDRFSDDRGFFARTYCETEYGAAGLPTRFVQSSVSFNRRKGTLRGMHFQADPHAEGKLVRCTAGAIYDVALDLRPQSPTYRRWAGVELTAENHRALYIPPGCAHGFQTLADASEVFYGMTAPYAPDAGRGVRWNDPAFAIDWPLPSPILSDRDASYADFLR